MNWGVAGVFLGVLLGFGGQALTAALGRKNTQDQLRAARVDALRDIRLKAASEYISALLPYERDAISPAVGYASVDLTLVHDRCAEVMLVFPKQTAELAQEVEALATSLDFMRYNLEETLSDPANPVGSFPDGPTGAVFDAHASFKDAFTAFVDAVRADMGAESSVVARELRKPPKRQVSG